MSRRTATGRRKSPSHFPAAGHAFRPTLSLAHHGTVGQRAAGELQGPTRRGQVHVFGQRFLVKLIHSRRTMDRTPDFVALLQRAENRSIHRYDRYDRPAPATADSRHGGDWRKGQRRRCGPFLRKKGHQAHACRRHTTFWPKGGGNSKRPLAFLPNSAHRICCQAESWDREVLPVTAWESVTILHCCTRRAMQYGQRGSTRASRGLPPFWPGADVSE